MAGPCVSLRASVGVLLVAWTCGFQAVAAAQPGPGLDRAGNGVSRAGPESATAAYDPTDADIALAGFRQRLADAAAKPTRILIGPGDSVTEGAGSGTEESQWTRRFAELVAEHMGTTPASYVDFWNEPRHQDFPIMSNTQTPTHDFGLGRQSILLSSRDTLITFSAPFSAVDVTHVVSADHRTGVFKYRVDGEAWARVDTGAFTSDKPGVITTARGFDPAVRHTLKIRLVSGLVWLEGLTPYLSPRRSESRFRVYEAARGGMTAASMSPMEAPTWYGSVPRTHASLVVLPLGSNDFFWGASAATTEQHLREVILELRGRLGAETPIVLVAWYDRPHFGTTAWADYRAMYRRLADTDPWVTWVDFSDLFGPSDKTTRGGLLVPAPDLVHPTDAGHDLIARTLAEVVTGVPVP